MLSRNWLLVWTLAGLCLQVACQASPKTDLDPVDASLVTIPTPLPLVSSLPAVAGSLVYPKQGAFWTYVPSTGDHGELARVAEGAFIGTPVVSPDGKLVAYSLYALPKPGETGGVDLYVMASDGSNQRLLLAHDEPWSSLSDPAWTPDSGSFYYTYRTLEARERIERVSIDGSDRRTMVEDAHAPTLSVDGRWLVFLTNDPDTGSNFLWMAAADGRNPKQLAGPRDFLAIAAPRFSPDSRRVVFSALQALHPTASRRSGLGDFFGPSVALAHGLPWDLWLLDVNGASPSRLTNLGEDAIIPAWSPDAKWLAFSGHFGLYLLDTERKQLQRLADQPTGVGLAWLNR